MTPVCGDATGTGYDLATGLLNLALTTEANNDKACAVYERFAIMIACGEQGRRCKIIGCQ